MSETFGKKGREEVLAAMRDKLRKKGAGPLPSDTSPETRASQPVSPAQSQEPLVAGKNQSRADIIQAMKRKIADAKNPPSSEAAPATIPAEIKLAADKLEHGKSLSEALTPIIGTEQQDAVAGIDTKIGELAKAIQEATPAEQAAIRGAMQDPQQPIPDTPSTRKIQGILDTIGTASKSITLPPKMRGYSKVMLLRPTGEVGTTILEAGISSLIVTSVLNAVGIPVTPYSVLHGVVYAVSAGGLGGMNLTTKSDRILRSAAEGFLKPLVADPSKRERISVTRTAMTALRLPLLAVSVYAGIAVAQGAISKTDESARIAGGLADPLQKFAEKKKTFDTQLPEFAKIPDKIFEIARKIETGKPGGARKGKNGDTTEYVAWSEPEKTQMFDELRDLFQRAGLDPLLVNTLKFNNPIKLGYGPAAKFKEALQTGITTNVAELSPQEKEALAKLVGPKATTAEYIVAIREKMGLKNNDLLERKMLSIIQLFFAEDTLHNVAANLSQAQQIEGIIRHQGEDALATFERAFLHGASPIGPEAIMPYAQAIVRSRTGIDVLSKEKLMKPIGEIFDTLTSALSAVGASVDLVTPNVSLDTSDMEHLATFITEITGKKAVENATGEAASETLQKLYDTFVPGGKKWDNTKRYLTASLLRKDGYLVRVRGNDTIIYSRIGGIDAQDSPESRVSSSMIQRVNDWVSDIYAGWSQPPRWNFSFEQIEMLSDEELSSQALVQLDDIMFERYAAEMRKSMEENETGWSPTMDAARLMTMYEMSAESLGTMIREQYRVVMDFQEQPYLLWPAAWEAITRGDAPSTIGETTPEQSSAPLSIDPTLWRQASPDETVKLLADYEKAAAWRGIAYIGGGVGGLVLGVLLLSLYPVHRLNRKLRASAPEFEAELKESERSIVGALDAINDTFAGIPILKELPRMDFSTLHAALRLAGEELFPAILSENPPPTGRLVQTMREAFARGPYAHSVEEIVSFSTLLDKLQRSTRMQQRVANILAPGSARAESFAKRLGPPQNQGGPMIAEVARQLDAIPNSVEREVFRDSARGNLRFRLAVLDARRAAFTGLRNEVQSLADDTLSLKLNIIDAEEEVIKNSRSELVELLAKLDKESEFERATEAYTAPRRFSGRRSERERADTPVSLLVPRDLLANKTFSAPRGIIDDVRAYVDERVARGS